MRPKTRYAKSGDIHIAYQVLGEGPDLVLIPGWFWHVDYIWELPEAEHLLTRLASFSRLIMFDQRGSGASDRNVSLGILEEQMDDVRAVMDEVGSDKAALFGASNGGFLAALFAATEPDRVSALVLFHIIARATQTEDYPFGFSNEDWRRLREVQESFWGTEGQLVGSIESGVARLQDDERIQDWWVRFSRAAGSPGTARQLMDHIGETDIRSILPTIRVPTLVMRREDDLISKGGAKDLADRIPGAKYVELPGVDQMVFFGDTDAVVDEVQEFITGGRGAPEHDRVLATVLFTDIVASTQKAAALGDRRWRGLLYSFYDAVRRSLERFRGREIKTLGDGLLATFDGPARAIRCAQEIIEVARAINLEVHTGLHTGECEVLGEDVGGLAVHIGARVVSIARPGEILVSSTVKDLVAGSGITFSDRGAHALKGVPGKWRLYSVDAS